jgi:hypothetical protein
VVTFRLTTATGNIIRLGTGAGNGIGWGNTATSRTVFIVNSGTGALNLSGLPLVTNNSGGNQFANGGGTCAAATVLAPTQSCSVVITRTRPTSGATAGNGTFTANDTGAATTSQAFELRGT